MTDSSTVTVRVTAIRSQNPRGFGGAIFTGNPIDAQGTVLDACTYVVVKANRAVLGATLVERGQWWQVTGPIVERRSVVDGFSLVEQQVVAEVALLAMPSGEHIITYIAENPAFEGLGRVKARKLWEQFGERLYGLLDTGDATAFHDILTEPVAQRLVEAWSSQGESRTLQWLQSQGFDIGLGRKVLRFFGAEAQTRIEEDPYRLLSFCGKWKDVDQLAQSQFGVAAEDPRRLRGAVEEACYRTFALGHTTMLTADLADQVAPLLGHPPAGVRWRDLLATAVSEGLSNGSIVKTPHGLQPLGAMVMERQVANAIRQRLDAEGQQLLLASEVDVIIEAVHKFDGIELNREQQNALHMAADNAFVCITGGAGVGKTTVLKSLYRLYDEVGVAVLQVALAGRAAKRMQEATGRPASTIASFLTNLNEATFDGNKVLVIDEASMVDIVSMSRLCAELPPHVRLVLVGDPHQLMPVGPGLVLHCVMQVPGIPSTELKTVKRYGGEIASVASAIRAGHWPAVTDNETAPVAFIPCDEKQVAGLVVELYALDPAGTQILAPLRNGVTGTKSLNALCQERFSKGRPCATNWSDEFDQSVYCGLNLGDIVLCTRNLWDKGLQNGSLGKIVEVTDAANKRPEEPERVLGWVEWDDGVRRALSAEMLEDLELGYAVTVHKAQGSQWPRVVIPVTASKLLDRTLLYTAITRAQTQVILVGDMDAARRATHAPPKAHSRRVALDLVLER